MYRDQRIGGLHFLSNITLKTVQYGQRNDGNRLRSMLTIGDFILTICSRHQIQESPFSEPRVYYQIYTPRAHNLCSQGGVALRIKAPSPIVILTPRLSDSCG